MYLFRCKIELSWEAKIKKVSPKPVYVVAEDRDQAISLVENKLKYDCKVSKVYKCAKQLSQIMFR